MIVLKGKEFPFSTLCYRYAAWHRWCLINSSLENDCYSTPCGKKVKPEGAPLISQPMTWKGPQICSGKCYSRLRRWQRRLAHCISMKLRGTTNSFAFLSKCVYGLCCFPQEDHFLTSNESCVWYGCNLVPQLGWRAHVMLSRARFPTGTPRNAKSGKY